MSNYELIQELEQLKKQVEHYETQVMPLAEQQLSRIREDAVKAYALNESEQQVMRERLTEASSEEDIQAMALQLAGQFRATTKHNGVDPTNTGNGARRTPKPVKRGEALAQDVFNKLKENPRYNKTITSIKPEPRPARNNGAQASVKGKRGNFINKLLNRQ